jgi:signal peptidase I
MPIEKFFILGIIISGTVWCIDKLLKNNNRLKSNSIFDTIKGLFPILLLIFSFRSFAFEHYRIPSSSMKPTFIEGDFVLVDKYSHGLRLPYSGTRLTKHGIPQRGDIVVFRGEINGDKSGIIKRIVGLPGDKIKYKNKTLYINGQEQTQALVGLEYANEIDGNKIPVAKLVENLKNKPHDIYHAVNAPNRHFPYADFVVPENGYFVMGDFRDNSHDSRYWGVLSDDRIIGKARLILASFDLTSLKNLTIRWDRFLEEI